MGYEIGIGDRKVFVEEDGTVWDSQHKLRQLAASLEAFEDKPPKGYTPEEVNVVEEEDVVDATIEEKSESPYAHLTCECGYRAKNISGLKSHKRSRHKRF